MSTDINIYTDVHRNRQTHWHTDKHIIIIITVIVIALVMQMHTTAAPLSISSTSVSLGQVFWHLRLSCPTCCSLVVHQQAISSSVLLICLFGNSQDSPVKSHFWHFMHVPVQRLIELTSDYDAVWTAAVNSDQYNVNWLTLLCKFYWSKMM